MQMQIRVQQVSFMVIMKGYESMNREISDRYRHYKDKDEGRMGVQSQNNLVDSPHMEEILEK